jgi:hypothetical protein
MSVRQMSIAVFIVAVLQAVSNMAVLADPPVGPARRATLTLDQIRKGIAQSRDKLRSLLVEYRATGYSKKGDESTPAVFYCVVAARGPYRFADSAHARNREDWENQEGRNQVYYTGKTLDVFYPYQRIYETSEQNAKLEFAWKVKDELYLNCLGWWPPDDPTPPRLLIEGRPHYLHDILVPRDQRVLTPPTVARVWGAFAVPSLSAAVAGIANVELKARIELPDFQVLAAQEQVDGSWCHVIEQPGGARLWIDPEIGFGVRRREVYVGRPLTLASRYELSDFRERSGVWIPWKVSRTQFLTDLRTGAANALILHTAATVVRVEVNETPEAFFRFEPPAGTLVKNRDTGKNHQIPGGLSLLDSVIETTAARAPVTKGTPVALTASQKWEMYGAFLTMLVVLVLNGWVLWHLGRGRRRSSTTIPADVSRPSVAGRSHPDGSLHSVQVGTGPSVADRTP